MTTNHAPINSEVAYSRDVISALKKTISLIKPVIRDLGEWKAKSSYLISAHKAAISPLRSFPPELLAEIFAQFVALPVARGWCSPKESPPLALMGICSRWRTVVLDTPRLWTRIFTAHPMIDYWITRSKSLPLRLDLDISFSNSRSTLQALVSHSHRWEYLNLWLRPDFLPVLARAKARLHSLKNLNLFIGDTSGTIDFCEVAPRLTEVKLTGVDGDGPPIIIKLPWSQLKVCTIGTSEIVHYVLQHAKNLQELHLDMSQIEEPPWGRMLVGPHSHHLELNTLIIKWSNEDSNIDSFFSSITLPSLQTLKIHFDYDFMNDDVDYTTLPPILAEFFERSCTCLSTLKLAQTPFSPNRLIKCLTFTSSLVSLDIGFLSWNETDNQLLHNLNITHSTHILPRLRSLALRGPGSMLTEEALDSLITSRRLINPKRDEFALLENLTLERWNFEGLPRFHRFVSEGLNITYKK